MLMQILCTIALQKLWFLQTFFDYDAFSSFTASNIYQLLEYLCSVTMKNSLNLILVKQLLQLISNL